MEERGRKAKAKTSYVVRYMRRNGRAASGLPASRLSGVRRPRGNRQRRVKFEHASHLEDKVIENAKARGIAFEYEPKSFSYTRPVRGGRCTVCEGTACVVKRSYTPDLHLLHSGVWVEIKGKFDADNRGKMEDFLRFNREAPEGERIRLVFLFQRDNWITKRHRSRYSDWCVKNEVDYEIGEQIPDRWLT